MRFKRITINNREFDKATALSVQEDATLLDGYGGPVRRMWHPQMAVVPKGLKLQGFVEVGPSAPGHFFLEIWVVEL